MSHLHLFNPENDLSLAHGKAQYTAPPNALRLHNAGSTLPLWFCAENDIVIVDTKHSQWVSQIKSQFEINGDIATPSNLGQITKCRPWGWSLHAKKQFLNFGVDEKILPTDAEILEIRELSHRRISIDVLSNLRGLLPLSESTDPYEAFDETSVIDYARKHHNIFIKSPWSSSGRGVVNVSNLTEQELCRRVGGIIRHQGSVICEKALDKVVDFAMLFYSNGKNVEFLGYSSFFNEATGAYAGNVIASQQEIYQSLQRYLTSINLVDISQILEQVLTNIIRDKYCGYMGVDMMIYRDEQGRYELAPCVEVNLRMTMGIVALLWGQRHLFEGSKGIMRVEYAPNEECEPNLNQSQPLIIDKKLKSGTISLIPPDNYFKITIKVSD